MLLSEAVGRRVVSTSSAETVGRITDYVLDIGAAQVAALLLKKTSGGGDTLPWTEIVAFGNDAVTVGNDAAIVPASGHIAELREKRFAAHGKRVLTTAGVELGVVDEVDFDPSTGAIRALLLKDGEVGGERLLAAGSYAVIVRA
jgi:sporulation protein YlmC with PRC-barrel domain